ncbi:MAG: helix-hairpin-helix domain-containing protein [Tepidisphaeraceae bacterium]|jgi:competence ComEA-like helix-hairpin-helix protein
MRVSPGDLWNASQRRGLIVLLGAILLALGIRLAMNRTSIGEEQPPAGPAAGQLADRIDPNTASAAELAAIPTLGPKRAQAIVDFRRTHPGKMFAQPHDLEQVSGIGPAIAENMEPYLIFPGDAATRP